MEHASCKDKQKAEGSPNKRRISVNFSGFLTLFLGGNAHFPSFCMNFFLLNGENCTKKCFDPQISLSGSTYMCKSQH